MNEYEYIEYTEYMMNALSLSQLMNAIDRPRGLRPKRLLALQHRTMVQMVQTLRASAMQVPQPAMLGRKETSRRKGPLALFKKTNIFKFLCGVC